MQVTHRGAREAFSQEAITPYEQVGEDLVDRTILSSVAIV